MGEDRNVIMLRGAHSLVGEKISVQTKGEWFDAVIKSYDDNTGSRIVLKPFALAPLYPNRSVPSAINFPNDSVIFYQELVVQLRCQKRRSDKSFADTKYTALQSLLLRENYSENLLKKIENCANKPYIGIEFSKYIENRWQDGVVETYDLHRVEEPFKATLKHKKRTIRLNLPDDDVVFMFEVNEMLRFQQLSSQSKSGRAHLLAALRDLCVRDEYTPDVLKTISKCTNEALSGLYVLVKVKERTIKEKLDSGETSQYKKNKFQNSRNRRNTSTDKCTYAWNWLSDDNLAKRVKDLLDKQQPIPTNESVEDAYVHNGLVRGRIEFIANSSSKNSSLKSCFKLHLHPFMKLTKRESKSGVPTKLTVPGPLISFPRPNMVFCTEFSHFINVVQSSNAANIDEDIEQRLLQEYTRHEGMYSTIIHDTIPTFVKSYYLGACVFVNCSASQSKNASSSKKRETNSQKLSWDMFKPAYVVDVMHLDHTHQIYFDLKFLDSYTGIKSAERVHRSGVKNDVFTNSKHINREVHALSFFR